MSAKLSVFESKATYYSLTTKKWIPGTFSLNETHIRFQVDNGQNETNLSLPLDTISGLEKRQSSFIYAALVVIVGPVKHWFASFQNRDAVYNLLELFWGQPLFLKSPPSPKTASTALGKELLGILHESECTLVDAANALSDQSRQLQESQVMLEDINADLTLAEKFLKNMSWLNVLGGLSVSEPKITEKLTDEDMHQKHFKITFTFTKSTSDFNNWNTGTLVLAENVLLLDERKNKRMMVNYDEIDKFLILSPWEFCLEYSSGLVTKQCYFMCPQLSSLLKFLSTFPSMENKITSNVDYDALYADSTSCLSPIFDISTAMNDLNLSSKQMQAEDSVMSDEDMAEITNALNNLQALATEVSREQKNQMEKINSLVEGVEKTDLKINVHNKAIKKAM